MTNLQNYAAAGLDLSGLYRQPVFTSRSREESHHLLANKLVEHDLCWHQGSVDTALFHAAIGRCDLFVLRYGAEVEVRPKPFSNFVLIQIPLRGSTSMLCDGVELEAKPGHLSVLAPRREARLTWRSGCEQLIIKVPSSLLQLAGTPFLAAGVMAASIHLPPLFCLEGRRGARGLRLIGELLDQLPNKDSDNNPQWLHHLEESLSTFLLTHQPGVESRSLGDRKIHRQAQKIETVMLSRLTNSITLQELADECGMSKRNLNNLCQHCYGQSPMEHMRNLRLEAARKRFLGSQSLSITEVALDYGFTHLGRFAEYYRERFRELPRQTLAQRI